MVLVYLQRAIQLGTTQRNRGEICLVNQIFFKVGVVKFLRFRMLDIELGPMTMK